MPDSKSAAILRAVIAQSDDCIRSRPEVNLYMLRAAALSLLGRDRDAAKCYQDALRLDHRAELYAALAATELRLGERQPALDALIAAGQFDPGMLLDTDVLPLRQEAWAALSARMNSQERMDALFAMGIALIDEERTEEAVLLFADAAQSDRQFIMRPDLRKYPNIVPLVIAELNARKRDPSRHYLFVLPPRRSSAPRVSKR